MKKYHIFIYYKKNRSMIKTGNSGDKREGSKRLKKKKKKSRNLAKDYLVYILMIPFKYE